MRDDLMGGLLATAVAAPAVIVCFGDGGVLLAGVTGAVAGWLTGPVCTVIAALCCFTPVLVALLGVVGLSPCWAGSTMCCCPR